MSNSSYALISEVTLARGDRWLVYRRLQELMIPCWCPADGTLLVEVNHCVDVILLRSAVQQLMASRLELTDWLERCWETQTPCPSNY
ncbi:MAG: hypothetical protein DSM107014_13230 [Gomphosphaeria aponina SAG 52.96 = DSM 107014]|uniref:Uncharacterized protein n=1 Tax=Gomphosphaeria aponina SAG 52.96 = DSM 107014 TaxID=1521640 RepID=A0A941GUR5_9CHRO|nr:hypothetical protein [Gomphosphaeria aponina SAG 52.96 = DSM 107014]